MTDIADLEAEMADEADVQERARDARARVAAFSALPPNEQHKRLTTLPDRADHRAATMALRRHEPDSMHDRLIRMENDCIALLRPEDQDYFRRRQ